MQRLSQVEKLLAEGKSIVEITLLSRLSLGDVRSLLRELDTINAISRPKREVTRPPPPVAFGRHGELVRDSE